MFAIIAHLHQVASLRYRRAPVAWSGKSLGRQGHPTRPPPRFGFPHDQQLWVPLPVHDAPPREGRAVQVFGRLAEGASWQDAAADLDVVSARAAADQPATHANLLRG